MLFIICGSIRTTNRRRHCGLYCAVTRLLYDRPAVGSGFVDGVPAVNIHHVSGGVRSSGSLPRKSWLQPALVSRKRLSLRSTGALSFSVHVGVPSVRVQWNERPWYSVSAWIARRFARFFFDFFVFLGLFSPSARCFLFVALVGPISQGSYPCPWYDVRHSALNWQFAVRKKLATTTN